MKAGRSLSAAVVVLVWGAMLSGAPAGREAQPPPGDLRLKAMALETIYELNLTPAQIKSLEKLAEGAAAKEQRHDRYSQPLRKALNDWCDAMARGDDDKVDDLHDKVDQLEEDAKLDDPYVEATDEGKKKSAEAMKIVHAGQLANLVSLRSDDIDDPAELLVDSLDEARGGSDEDFNDLRDSIASDVVELCYGYGADTGKIAEKVSGLLTRVHKMSDAEYKSKTDELASEARKLVGTHDAFEVLKHWTQREFAELLSNPELPAAIKERASKKG